MRTKTLLLTAALSAAGIATSMAQVYSVNAVGYVNSVLAPGFNLIANPLNAPTNTVGALIPVAPDGAQFYKFTPGTGYTTITYDELAASWQPDGNIGLAPGEGGFFFNNSGAPLTLTFVGEVMQGTLNNPLPLGFSIKSSMVPQTGNVNVLGVPGQDGDQIYKFTPGTVYATSTFDALDNDWTPTVPVINVGEAFFINKVAAQVWTRTFTVN
jgi:hypothetical protein